MTDWRSKSSTQQQNICKHTWVPAYKDGIRCLFCITCKRYSI